MSGRVLHATPGKVDVWHDLGDGRAAVEMLIDRDPVIREVREISDANAKPHEAMRLEAVAPPDVVRRAYAEGWFHDPAAWRRWANDPQNRPFRIERNGRVKTL